MTSPSDLQARMNALGFRSDTDIERFMRESYLDYRAFCRRMKIRRKEGDVVQMVPTPAQMKLDRAIEEMEKRKVPVRIIVLKARQVHMSVGVASQIFRKVAFNRGQHALVYGDVYNSAKNIWGYYDQFSRTYDSNGGVQQLRIVGRTKDDQITWDGDSYVDVRSAERATGGRSASIRFLHLSEVAFWRAPLELRTGLLQSVPRDPGTMIIDESTAKGVNTPFHKSWLASIRGENEWKPVFFAWWEHPEYMMPLPVPRDRFQDSITREEWDLINTYRLTYEQVAWRRWKIANECEGSVDRFRQEMPSNPEEAFLTSGRPFFDFKDLARQQQYVQEKPLHGRLELVDLGTRKQIQFIPNEAGELAVFSKPLSGHKYVIGADSAQGIDVNESKGSAGHEPDFSVAVVVDRATGEQVATLRLRMGLSRFGEYLCILARWYNHAFLVPEAVGQGVAVIEEIQRQQYPVHLVYARRRSPDDKRPPLTEEIGWKTTEVSRPQLLSVLDRAIREGSLILRDQIVLGEHYSFVYRNDRPDHDRGCHDDCVFASALAVMGLRFAPSFELPSQEQRRADAYEDEDDDDRPARGNRFGGRYGYRSVR